MSEDDYTRERAEEAANKSSLKAIRKAAQGDVDGARTAREEADLARHLLRGQHDPNN